MANNPRASARSGNVCLNLAVSHYREPSQAQTDLVRAHLLSPESASCLGSYRWKPEIHRRSVLNNLQIP
jgi:hypothetical protein